MTLELGQAGSHGPVRATHKVTTQHFLRDRFHLRISFQSN